jgi:multidrug efflux pump subunit AcrA (membrane-fusion protein)
VWLLAGCVLLIAGLLYFGRVYVVVTAAGKILPEGDVLIVQALRPGVVNAILAHAGDRLEAGAVIARLDTSESGALLAEQRGKLSLQERMLGPVHDILTMVNQVMKDPNAFFNGNTKLLPTVGNTMQMILAVGDAKSKLDGAKYAVTSIASAASRSTSCHASTASRCRRTSRHRDNRTTCPCGSAP